MPPEDRLTSCAASDHPDPAVAVGETVGHIQNTLAGSPQFALVLIGEGFASRLSTVAGAVHHLLGPDLLLATVGSLVAGADHLAPSRGSVVLWALCGVEVAALHDHEGGPGSAAVVIRTQPDEAVTVAFTPDVDSPQAVFVTGDGLHRRTPRAGVRFPPGSATVLESRGRRMVGPVMTATEARGHTLSRLDHVPVRGVLVDQLQTTDAFVDGPSTEFPPLKAQLLTAAGEGSRRTVDVVAVDPDEGFVELSGPVEKGDRVQLLADDPNTADERLIDRILTTRAGHQRAVLLDAELSAEAHVDLEPIPTAALHRASDRTTSPAGGRRPWATVKALVVHVADDV